MTSYSYNVVIDASSGNVTLSPVSSIDGTVLQNNRTIQLPKSPGTSYQLTFNAASASWESASFWPPHEANPALTTNFITIPITNGTSTSQSMFNQHGTSLALESLDASTLIITNTNNNNTNNSVFIGMRFVLRANGLHYCSEDPQIEDLKTGPEG